jgi:hypothetical protein
MKSKKSKDYPGVTFIRDFFRGDHDQDVIWILLTDNSWLLYSRTTKNYRIIYTIQNAFDMWKHESYRLFV